MNKVWLLISCICFSGCVSVETAERPARAVSVKVRNKLVNVDQARLGMTAQEIAQVLGEQVKIGYKQNEHGQESFQPIVIDNPYRREFLQAKEEMYAVFYYFTVIKKADDIIAEDELTPLVFRDNKLIGKGWDFLFELKKEVK